MSTSFAKTWFYRLYALIITLLLPFYLFILAARVRQGKEIDSRIKERFGIASAPKFSKNDHLLWFHAASVGESIIVLTLIDSIRKNTLFCKQDSKINFLVTTGTVTSATILASRLPADALHQFLPIDNVFFVKRFLKYWQPDLAIFIEAELWPCVLYETSKLCPLLLFNARLSDKSFAHWQKIPSLFRLVTEPFAQIFVQSETDLKKFRALGTVNAINAGNIKFAHQKLAIEPAELAPLIKSLEARKVIVLASSHFEDEQVFFEIIKPLKVQFPECYFIIVLRHPDRAAAVLDACKALSLKASLRSQRALPDTNDDIYIVDKFGELGLFYSLAYVSFVGGSFKQGGHNPIEPAHFGNLIIFGPDMNKCQDIASTMLERKAALQIKNSNELLKQLQYFLTPVGTESAKLYQEQALAFVKDNEQILGQYLEALKNFTPLSRD